MSDNNDGVDLDIKDDLFEDYTNNGKNRYDDEVNISINKFADKSIQIKNMVIQFELRLLGYMNKNNGEKMVYMGKPIIGNDTIQKVMLLLEPFSQDSNLITNKDDALWEVQLARTRYDLVILLTKNNDFEASNTPEVWRGFTNLMNNIGDIIKGKNSKGLIESMINLNKDKDVDGGFI